MRLSKLIGNSTQQQGGQHSFCALKKRKASEAESLNQNVHWALPSYALYQRHGHIRLQSQSNGVHLILAKILAEINAQNTQIYVNL